MAVSFSKVLRRWFLSIDQVLLFSVFALIAIGIWVSVASTPALAMKLGFLPFHFVKLHLLVVPIAIFILLFTSFLQPKHIRRLALIGYFLCLILIACTLFWGAEIKGARRWLNICGFSLQPSEFLKPITAVLTAWLITEQYNDRKFPGIILSIVSLALAVPLLLLQPDIGMTAIITCTFFAQLFISGLSIPMIVTFVASIISAMFVLYVSFPHFTDRIDKFFMKSEDADVFQIQKSIEAFKSGGFFGKGPGEGVVKMLVPDSHSDFVFSVIGEEFGFMLCIIVIAIFALFIIRVISKILATSNMFNFVAVFGLLVQILMQVIINICTSLNLIPTKGMTLPFISYGGSSMLAMAISFGIIITLTKRSALHDDVF